MMLNSEGNQSFTYITASAKDPWRIFIINECEWNQWKQFVPHLDKANRCEWDVLILSGLSGFYQPSKTMQLNVSVLSFNLSFSLCTNHLISFNKHPRKAQGAIPLYYHSVRHNKPVRRGENMKGHLVLIVTPCLLITSNQSLHIHSEDLSQSRRWHSTIVKKQVINGWAECCTISSVLHPKPTHRPRSCWKVSFLFCGWNEC